MARAKSNAPSIEDKARHAIISARSQLIVEDFFYGALATRLKMVPKYGIPTMATDGKSIFYSPVFVNTLTIRELRSVISHEIMHCVLLHHLRRGTRDPMKWNIAGDYLINHFLTKEGKTLPGAPYLSKKYDDTWTTEKIYDDLPDDIVSEKKRQLFILVSRKCQGQGKGDSGEGEDGQDALGGDSKDGTLPDGLVIDAEINSESEATTEEQEWRVAVIQAAKAAKMMGKLPGHIESIVGELTKPKINWKEVLRRFVQTSATPDDFTWHRPYRQLVSQGLFFPSTFGESVGEMVVVVDTSGSISDHEATEFLSEIQGIREDARPEKIHLVYCDAMVQKTEEYEPDGEPLKLDLVGRGGTDFRPPFKWVEEQQLEPICLVYLTDMYGAFPNDPPRYPVLWISNSQVDEAPFGEVVRLR